MKFRKRKFSKWLLILITALSCSWNLYAKDIIVDEIDCGELNVGQEKYITFEVTNYENIPLVIDRLTACCGNPKPTISSMTIPVGGKAEFVQLVKRVKAGPFTITSRVFLKESDGKTLSFRVKGEAKQPVLAAIGWAGESLKHIDYHKDSLRINQINRNGKDLVLCLSAKQNHFNLNEAIVSITSKYFSLDSSSLGFDKNENNSSKGSPQGLGEKKSYSNNSITITKQITKQLICQKGDVRKETCVNSISRLNLRLNANAPFPIGELSDKITVEFRDGTACYIPIVFRVVDDIYGESSSMAIGKIPLSETVSRIFKIHFNNEVKPWTQVRWRAEGKLSEAIKVFPSEENNLENILSVIIEIRGERLSQSAKGFISSHIDFFENEQDDNKVRLLMYGYR